MLTTLIAGVYWTLNRFTGLDLIANKRALADPWKKTKLENIALLLRAEPVRVRVSLRAPRGRDWR